MQCMSDTVWCMHVCTYLTADTQEHVFWKQEEIESHGLSLQILVFGI